MCPKLSLQIVDEILQKRVKFTARIFEHRLKFHVIKVFSIVYLCICYSALVF